MRPQSRQRNHHLVSLIPGCNRTPFFPILMAIRTVFLMTEECGRGDRQGWYEFVRDYVPLIRQLVEQYFPMLAPEMEAHVAALLQRARQPERMVPQALIQQRAR